MEVNIDAVELLVIGGCLLLEAGAMVWGEFYSPSKSRQFGVSVATGGLAFLLLIIGASLL